MSTRFFQIEMSELSHKDEPVAPQCEAGCMSYHSKAEVAAMFNVTVRTIYNWIRDGLRVGRRGYIKHPWIDEYMSDQ